MIMLQNPRILLPKEVIHRYPRTHFWTTSLKWSFQVKQFQELYTLLPLSKGYVQVTVTNPEGSTPFIPVYRDTPGSGICHLTRKMSTGDTCRSKRGSQILDIEPDLVGTVCTGVSRRESQISVIVPDRVGTICACIIRRNEFQVSVFEPE